MAEVSQKSTTRSPRSEEPDNVTMVLKLKQNYDVLKRKFLEIAEELKMRRVNDQEAETKINNLITEKFELKKHKDEEITKLSNNCEELKIENLNLNKELEKKAKLHEEEKNTQTMSANSSCQGIKSLKDEILALQLTKYSLQKKIKDQEHQLQSESRTREDVLKQIDIFKCTTEEYKQQYAELSKRMQYLSDLVIKTENMHQNLVDKSSHHQTIISKYEETMTRIQGELTQTKAKLVQLQKEKEKDDKGLPHSTKSLSGEPGEQQLRSINDQLKNEVNVALQQKQFYMNSLSEVNRTLMGVQVKYDSTHAQRQTLQTTLDESKQSNKLLVDKLNKVNKKIIGLESRVNSLQNEAGLKEQIIQSTKSENINLQERIKVLSISNESMKLQHDKNSIEIRDSIDLQSEERQALVVSSESHDTISMKDYQPEEKPSAIIKENVVTGEKNENVEQISDEMKSKSNQIMKNFNFNSRKRQLSEPNGIPFVETETGNKTSVNLKQYLFGTKLVSNNKPKTNQNIDEKMENDSETVEKASREEVGKVNLEDLSTGIKRNTINDISNPLILAEQKTDAYHFESGNNRILLEKNDKDVDIVTRMVVDAVSNGEI